MINQLIDEVLDTWKKFEIPEEEIDDNFEKIKEIALNYCKKVLNDTSNYSFEKNIILLEIDLIHEMEDYMELIKASKENVLSPEEIYKVQKYATIITLSGKWLTNFDYDVKQLIIANFENYKFPLKMWYKIKSLLFN
jgi:hypothetical protein